MRSISSRILSTISPTDLVERRTIKSTDGKPLTDSRMTEVARRIAALLTPDWRVTFGATTIHGSAAWPNGQPPTRLEQVANLRARLDRLTR